MEGTKQVSQADGRVALPIAKFVKRVSTFLSPEIFNLITVKQEVQKTHY